MQPISAHFENLLKEAKMNGWIRNTILVLSVALSYVGAVVGAGFISGQELAQFFLKFGLGGVLAWVITSIVCVLGGSFFLYHQAVERPDSFDVWVTATFGSISKFVIQIFNGYLLGGLVIMLAGSSSILAEFFNVSELAGVLIISSLIFVTIVGKGERLLKVNRFLIPILILITIFVSVHLLSGDSNWKIHTFDFKNPSALLPNWWISVFLYLGYNIVGGIVGFINIARDIDPETGKKGGFVGGLLVSLLGTLLLASLWITYPQWNMADLPIVHIIRQNVPLLYIPFTFVMLIAMFSVATTYALGISKYLHPKINVFTNKQVDFRVVCFGTVAMVAPLSLLGFSRLLGIIYPIFGILATFAFTYLVVSRLIVRLTRSRIEITGH